MKYERDKTEAERRERIRGWIGCVGCAVLLAIVLYWGKGRDPVERAILTIIAAGCQSWACIQIIKNR